MKPKAKVLVLIISVITLTSSMTSAQTRKDLAGKWDAFAPMAPPEFQRSIVRITRDSVFMSMDGIHFMPALSMEFRNDTLNYVMKEASFRLTFESNTKMKGMAYWPVGESEFILTRKD